ncbi:hypothetical protein DQ238_00240 [Geodermatophilus sp. TF02-6]|nr:hypothetical protein DQ238_00240 [Geodermatophilus sp. TF02-6]
MVARPTHDRGAGGGRPCGEFVAVLVQGGQQQTARHAVGERCGHHRRADEEVLVGGVGGQGPDLGQPPCAAVGGDVHAEVELDLVAQPRGERSRHLHRSTRQTTRGGHRAVVPATRDAALPSPSPSPELVPPAPFRSQVRGRHEPSARMAGCVRC